MTQYTLIEHLLILYIHLRNEQNCKGYAKKLVYVHTNMSRLIIKNLINTTEYLRT